jgi:rhodanese-related sulfurtransferase
LQRQTSLRERPTIIDVRSADENAAGHIPGALHIPAEELSGRLAEIPRDRPVVTY